MKFALVIFAVLLGVGPCTSQLCRSATTLIALDDVMAALKESQHLVEHTVENVKQGARNATQLFSGQIDSAWQTINDVMDTLINDRANPKTAKCKSLIRSLHPITMEMFRNSIDCVNGLQKHYKLLVSDQIDYAHAKVRAIRMYMDLRCSQCELDQDEGLRLAEPQFYIPECLAEVKDELTAYSSMYVAQLSKYRSKTVDFSVAVVDKILHCNIETGLSVLPDQIKKVFSVVYECNNDFIKDLLELMMDLFNNILK